MNEIIQRQLRKTLDESKGLPGWFFTSPEVFDLRKKALLSQFVDVHRSDK